MVANYFCPDKQIGKFPCLAYERWYGHNFSKHVAIWYSPLTKLAAFVTIFLPSVWRQAYLLSTFYNFLSKTWKCTYVLLANQFFHIFHVQMGKPLIGYLKTIKILHYLINYLSLSRSWRKTSLEKHLEKYMHSLTVQFTRKLVIQYSYL